MEGQTIAVAKSAYNRLGFALFATAASTVVLQFMVVIIASQLLAQGYHVTDNMWFFWAAAFVPLYVIGIPLGLWMMRKAPVEPGERMKLSIKNFSLFLLMCFPIMYGGNLIGTGLSAWLSGGTATNTLLYYISDESPLRILVMVVLAPIVEEYLFRKQLIDRCIQYGEKTAILFSALMFGLFHMNLYQFFYAFGIGLVFAYVYTRTRCLRYPILMHMVFNFMGSVLSPLMLSQVDPEALSQVASGDLNPEALLPMLPALGAYMGYVLLLLGLSIAGLVLLIVKVPKLVYRFHSDEIPKGKGLQAVYCNAGVILFVLFCAAMCALNLVAS